MLMIIFNIILFLLISFTLVQVLLSKDSSISDPQLSVIESGFEALKYSSLLSASFFMLAVLFVLFDMELILLLPFLMNNWLESLGSFIIFSVSMLFISITLMWEWWYHGLKWSS